MVNNEQIETRIYKLADQVASHEMRLREHAVLIETQRRELSETRTSMATADQLKAAVALLSLKFDYLSSEMAPIRRGVYWAVTLILGAVALAVLALVLTPKVQLP